MKKISCIILSLFLLISFVGCNNNEKSSTEKKWREPKVTETVAEKFIDTDGIFEYKTQNFEVTADFVIVYPNKDDFVLKLANTLKEYYKSACDLDLAVVSDKTTERKNEILIGKTNRKQSDVEINESDLKVLIDENKLVFVAGHNVTLKSAVEKFSRLEYKQGKTFTFEITTDFKSKMLGDYEYVWGDEFEGSDLDFTKWDFEEQMGGSGKIEVSWDKDVVDVNEGRLKLHALNYFNPMREGTKYKVPYSVVSKYKMNYKYGYAEIRARVPYYKGSWPSFWGLNIGGMGGANASGGVCYNSNDSAKQKYGVEVDIFEIFGSNSVVTPNVHKWYRSNNLNYDEKFGVQAENHTQLTSKSVWNWAEKGVDLDNLSNEYHIYGFEWTEKEMNFYVDGEKYYTLDIVNSYDLFEDMSRFHDPIYLMFNNHVFADDQSWYENLVEDHSVMPFCYYIDWFRLYQKPGAGELYIEETPKEYSGR